MTQLSQSPTDPVFVQDPYPFYDAARAQGAIGVWEEFGMPAAFTFSAVNALLRDNRLGRVPHTPVNVPEHLRDFYAIEDHSMLELEAPRHTRLRKLVLHAFTSRRIAALEPEIRQLCHDLIDQFPDAPFDLIPAYCTRVPVIIIARLLGVPDEMADQLLRWSNDMVALYQARRDHEVEVAANAAARDFATWLRAHVETRRETPADDLITHLIRAEEDGERLSTDELISTCVLLLNAGHEATVHTMGNGVKALLEHGMGADVLTPEHVDGTVEEILRYDPPLHMFTRYVYEPVEVGRSVLEPGTEVALILGAAGRDPGVWDAPEEFRPNRPVKTHAAFGAGRHFCVGAPLARLELKIALPVLFERCPHLRLDETPRYANLYHFHGLERLMVSQAGA
ncbi:cytochrome P450 [Primorskyibacter sp. S187A]|uniref:cytochrome P450 n=1 Tax=Primorskyibacter sp. S187A TaxID=3415130 RepID=UPI003C7A53C0